MAGKAVHDADRVFEPIPPRNLQHDSRLVGQRSLLEVRGADDVTASAVVALKGRLAVPSLQDAARVQDRSHRVASQVLVLGREGIDARRDDADPRWVESLPDISIPGEDARGGFRDIRP